jgi:acyl-CoA synthetase (AMP-forming)/AMP-acid ligase II
MISRAFRLVASKQTIRQTIRFSSSNIIVKGGKIDGVSKNGVSNPISFPEYMLQSCNRLANMGVEDAIIDGASNEKLTYRQLHDSTYSFAHNLKTKLGIKKGDTIALYAPNHVHYFTVFHGIGLTGGNSTPINPQYTFEEVRKQLEACDAKAIVAHPLCISVAKEAAAAYKNIPVLSLGKVSNDNKGDVIPVDDFVNVPISKIDKESFHGIDPESIMTIPFSSGTTGNPKGVMLTHNNLVANVLQGMPFEGKYMTVDPNNIENRGVLIAPLPFFHIFGMIASMSVPLAVGGKMIFLPAFDLVRFLELIQEHKVSRAHIVPPICLALAKHPIVDNYDLSSLNTMLCAAAPLTGEVQTLCSKRLNVAIKQGWGMSELSPIGTLCDDPEGAPETWDLDKYLAETKGSGGRVVAETEAKIVDAVTGADLPYTQEGELMIRGPQVMKGYFQNEKATKETINSEGWLSTGDIAYFNDKGYMFITDRKKELIKTSGFQVAPAELEGILGGFDCVADVIVIPVLHEKAGEVPRAYVVKQPGFEHITEDEVAERLAAVVAPYKRLGGGVNFVKAIPKSASGKLLRRIQIQIDRGEIPPL